MIIGFVIILFGVLIGANILAFLEAKEPPTNANIRTTQNNPEDYIKGENNV